ncbi:VOC family protein [Streptomyces sp. RB6PN25]|uniref:VOC family protein n=1 Tax=Streptomyces humicola TaxID=2953240 RepID=A0ABT1PWU3_9ACTN|nr:VOC family protein [Streptomyces humicola]MCQ4082104.1 VOC family protein [Streptomyces humicola]
MTSEPTDPGPELASVVIFVQDLDESARFYCGLLGLEITTRESTALMLAGEGQPMIVLRAIGPHGEHPMGGIGIQYAVWAAHDADDLRRCERFLKDRSAHIATNVSDGRTIVEGRDPNGLPVMVVHPGPDRTASPKIMTRVYAW